MIEFNYHFRVFFIPLLALISPFIIVVWRVYKNKLSLVLSKKNIASFIIVWSLLALVIFTFLLYLTGGITVLLRLEKSFFVSNRAINWNATEHLSIIFVYDPGISLLVISILSALLYASIITLPKVCTLINSDENINNMTSGSATTTVTSSISATGSAFASTAVCCSTSTLSILAPSVGVFLGPFVPGLLIFSLAVSVYSFVKIVLPKFVIPSPVSVKNLISIT